MAPDDASDPGIRLKPMRPWCLPLPYVTELFPDELLSSWLRRTGTEYGVSLELLARHIGLLKTKPAEIDHDLSPDEIERLADAMRVERSDIRRRLHHPLRPSVCSLRADRAPIQVCATCRTRHLTAHAPSVVLRAWFEFWQIECQACQRPMSSPGSPILDRCNPAREHPNWFSGIMPTARRGAVRLHAFARRPFNVALSPVAVLRLLSKPLSSGWPDDDDPLYGVHRVADLFVPGLHELAREEGVLIPDIWTPQKPVQLVTARIILLAGLSNFLADPKASFRRVQDAADNRVSTFLERWINALPPQIRSSLS